MQQVDLLIRDACIITMDRGRRVIDDGAVAIDGGRIAAVGGTGEILGRFEGRRTLSARDRYLYPGLVSTHTHLFQCLLKGLGRDRALFDWLNASVWRALRNYDEEAMYYAALVGLIDSVRSGTTTVCDHQYCHPRPGIDASVIQAYLDAGVHGVLCRVHAEVGDLPPEMALDYAETEDDYFRELEGLCTSYRHHSLIDIAMGPSMIWDHQKSGFLRTREFANAFRIPISMHLAETEEDDRFAMKRWGMSAVDFLEHCGMLGPDLLVVHAVHVRDEDIRRFRDYEVKVSHCPVSNMLLASGTAPVPRYLEEGITVSLACDGAASNDTQDMLDVMRIAALKHKLVSRDASVVPAQQVLEMATIGGARALGLEDRIGSIEEGKMANLFIWSANNARAVPVNDPISSLVYSSSTCNVETTIIGGRTVLDHGRLTTLDETVVLRKAQQVADGLIRRSGLRNAHWGQSVPARCGLASEDGAPTAGGLKT